MNAPVMVELEGETDPLEVISSNTHVKVDILSFVTLYSVFLVGIPYIMLLFGLIY